MGFLFNKLLKPLLFSDYEGLPVSGRHTVKDCAAILIDHSRTDPFEKDNSFREVPVHFYYPEPEAEQPLPPLSFQLRHPGKWQQSRVPLSA